MNERQQLMQLLKPKPISPQKKRENGQVWVVVTVIGIVLLLCVLLAAADHILVAGATGGPSCEIQLAHSFNHAVFTTTWSGGYEAGEYPFYFGDNAPANVLTGTQGVKVLPHDYGYLVNDVISYTAGFTVTDSPTETVQHCEQVVVIDDRPVITLTHQIYLPLVFNQFGPPQVSMKVDAGPEWNDLIVQGEWSGGYCSIYGPMYAHLDWGDQTGVDLPSDCGNITQTASHDYDYLGGRYTIVLTVSGPGGMTSVSKIVTVILP